MNKKAYVKEYRVQLREHPSVPKKYVKRISKDHLRLKKRGKKSHG